jgi:excisionase family DNA binding protein
MLFNRRQRVRRIDDEKRATYKVPEAARVAGTGPKAIRDGIAADAIPHIKFGRNILIPKAAFHRWLDSCGRRTAA